MNIIFYLNKNNRCPVKQFIETLEINDRAKILACLKNIEELGFSCRRVQFRQIRGALWEIKIRSYSGGFRIFYVAIKSITLVLLHAYQKQSTKAPKNEIKIAEQRFNGVLKNEKNYT